MKNPILLWITLAIAAALAGCTARAYQRPEPSATGSDGPANQGPAYPAKEGNADAGKNVFRFETFGNEGFWTDAIRLPEGMKAQKVTPLQALKLGVSVDVDKLDSATVSKLKDQLKADPTGARSAILNDPAMTAKLINADAVIGMPIKDSNGDGVMDIEKGDKAGVSCALCHTITDGSVMSLPDGGSIGHREDGRTNHNLNIGKILATAANSRAFYPHLQLALKANGGKTFGRAPTGITENSTEAEVDAYLSNPDFFPVGMFDDTPDGNGDPIRIVPLFRQDLAAPFGSAGVFVPLDSFSNLAYTVLLDPTNDTSPGGRALLHLLGGKAGDEIVDNYVKILKETGVTGYPFVKTATTGKPGSEGYVAGVRVDNTKLMDLNAYLAKLPAPAGAKVDQQAAMHGKQLFRTVGCTGCHNVDQGKPVPSFLVPMKTIFPGFNPTVMAQRTPPLNPIQHTPGSTFDLKMAVVNATIRGDIDGIAMPLLLDLARKRHFLQDNSVSSLDQLLDPKRGAEAPHPFYVSNTKDRSDLVDFLKALDTNGPRFRSGG